MEENSRSKEDQQMELEPIEKAKDTNEEDKENEDEDENNENEDENDDKDDYRDDFGDDYGNDYADLSEEDSDNESGIMDDENDEDYDEDDIFDEDLFLGPPEPFGLFDLFQGGMHSADEDDHSDASDNSIVELSYDDSSDNSSLNFPDNAPAFRSFALPPFPPPLSNKPSIPDDFDAILDDLIQKQSHTTVKRFSSHLTSHEAQAYDYVKWSIWNEKEKIALILIDKFADSNSRILGRDPDHWPDESPLHVAVELGNVNVIKKLLEKNANLNLKNPRECITPIKSALLRNRHDLVALFVDHLAQMPPSDLPLDSDIKPLHYACMGMNLEHIRHFFYLNPADVNLPIDQTCAEELSGYTPLHLAAEFGNKQTVDFLLDNGAKLETKARQLKTPLHVATDFLKYFRRKLNPDKLSEQVDIIKSLLDRGSDVNAKNEIGATPLFSVLTSSLAFLKSDTVNYYLHQDNEAGLEDYLTMLQNDHDPLKIAEILLDRGAKTDGILYELVHALYWGDYEKKLIKFLQSRGLDINAKARRKTPLLALVISHRLYVKKDEVKSREDMMKFLLICGANTECTYTEKLLTALHWAVRHSHTRVVKMLLHQGANPNALDRKERTPLHMATIKMDDTEAAILRRLVNFCPDINIIDIFAKTAMNYFVETAYLNQESVYDPPIFDLPEQIIKYKEIGYFVSKANESALQVLLRQHETLRNFPNSCQEEIKRLKKEKIDGYSSFYSILHKTPNQLAHKSNSVKFRKIVDSFKFDENGLFQPAKYRIYGPIIKFLYRRGAQRFQRMQEAEQSMTELIKFQIPNLCCEEIFSRLTDEQLKNLKESTKYLKKKEN